MDTFLLENVPGPLLGLGIVAVMVVASVAGVVAVRRRVDLAALEPHKDVAGFILAVVSVVYAVLLAFVVVSVWEEFEDAKASANAEAAALWLLHQDALFLGDDGAAAAAATEAYARSVVADEWPAMERAQQEAPETDAALEGMWDAYAAIDPPDRERTVFFDHAVERLHEASELRRTRIFASREGLPGALWVVLIVGAVICIAFTYFFGLRSLRVQVLMVAALGATLGLVLFLALSLELPFTGDMRVGPDALRRIIVEFGHRGG